MGFLSNIKEKCMTDKEKLKEAIDALKYISNPIKYLQDDAMSKGHQFNGQMGISISQDHYFLKQIAIRCLAKIESSEGVE